jgi:spermidine/putrescine transport system ATP-binding protein
VTTGKASALSVRGVSKAFTTPEGGEVRALDDVSLDVADGSFMVLLGPSGCGKTTLLRCIAGLESPDSGEILLRGERIDTVPVWKRRVNTVFQSYALFPHMTVAQNIAFGLQMDRLPKAEITRKVEESLELVRLGALGARRPQQLSGGQQQRVALARALAKEPEVLLLDEPLSALDLKLRRGMQLELKRLQQETHITFILVTHDQDEAMSMGDQVAVFNEGRIVQVGEPRDVYLRPRTRFVADFIGEANLLDLVADGAGVNVPGWGAVPQEAWAPDSPNPTAGGHVAAVRPEDVLVTPQAQGRFTIIDATFIGGDLHAVVDLGGTSVSTRQPAAQAGDIITGGRCDVGFRPGSVRIVESP